MDLDDTSPPVWRRIEVAADLYLDQIHDVLQVVFGWTDSHLHQFVSASLHSERTEHYLSPFDMAEGDDGVAEEQVRLEEVLGDVGDRLSYQYDYGDDWQDTLLLEAVVLRETDAPPAVCSDGQREGPPEDCGGVYGYEMIVGAIDPGHPAHAELAAAFSDMYGEDVDPESFELTPCDPDAINRRLGHLDLTHRPQIGQIPDSVADLFGPIVDPTLRRRLLELLSGAGLDQPVTIDADTAARVTHPYQWLLQRVGANGIALTSAGYLPPVHVRAAVDELGLGGEWIGAGNREVQTRPVLHLRESAQQIGLLRKQRGRLSLTARGRAVTDDPMAMWLHLADRMPLGSSESADGQAGVVLLLSLAAQAREDVQALVAEVLDARRWRYDDGTRLSAATVNRILWDNVAVLRRIGALTSVGDAKWPGDPTGEGVAFARAALHS